MNDLQNLQDFFSSLLQQINQDSSKGEGYIHLSQKIQDILILLQSNLTNKTQKDLFEADIALWKQHLQSTGYGELLEGPLAEQMEQLFTAVRIQNIATIGQTFETLAAFYDESEQPPDTAEIIASLQKHIPKPYFDQIELRLKNANPNLLHQTLRQVAQQLKEQPENIDLDAVVQVFEQNLGGLFGKDEAQKDAKRMEGYRLSARQSILKSLKANGFQNTEE